MDKKLNYILTLQRNTNLIREDFETARTGNTGTISLFLKRE